MLKRLSLALLAAIFSSTNPPAFAAINGDSVKKEFLHAWAGYKKYAWGHDELKPLTHGARDWYKEPLLFTPVDALDTMLIMGLRDEAREAKELILAKLSFDKDLDVSTFEITIRHLGGLLSAYQLDGDPRLLKLATDLGNRLLPAYRSKTGMPYSRINLKTGAVSGPVSNPAIIGTSIIEFGTLSRLTGDPAYFNASKKALLELHKRRSAIGLVGSLIDVETGEWKNSTAHIGGMIDSYYEYILKGSLLFNDPELKQMWQESIKAVNTYLPDTRFGALWYGRVDMTTGQRTQTKYGALDAFFAALLALGGDIPAARKLQESNFKMWTLSGIEPETLDYSDMSIKSPSYPLRPENIESAYYLYHFTGDPKYQEMGRKYFKSLVKYCRTDSGYASLISVKTKAKDDAMESFFLAETLKYLYLLLSPPNAFDFDKHIFNTEAHPMLR